MVTITVHLFNKHTQKTLTHLKIFSSPDLKLIGAICITMVLKSDLFYKKTIFSEVFLYCLLSQRSCKIHTCFYFSHVHSLLVRNMRQHDSIQSRLHRTHHIAQAILQLIIYISEPPKRRQTYLKMLSTMIFNFNL